MKLAQSRGIPIFRRFSGGGTVYHDLGNLNYSLHRDKSVFNRTFAAEMIIRAMQEHVQSSDDSGLFLSPRNDIFFKHYTGSSAKVSGSAYKLSKDRAYHHGTLLLSSDLSNISTLLKSPLTILKDDAFKFGGVSSFPSPVTNIPNLSIERTIELICKEFQPTEPIIEITKNSHSNPTIAKYQKEIESLEWTFGKSPTFKLLLHDENEVLIEAGVVKESSKDENLLNKFLNKLL